MEIELVTAGSSTDSSTDRTEFSQEDFLELLTAELTNQDPLNPLENVEFLNQLVSLQTLEATGALTDGIAALTSFQSFSTASGLIGKEIVGVGGDGGVVAGQVEKVIYSAHTGEIHVVVNGQEVALQNVVEVTEPTDPVEEAIEEFDAEAEAEA